MNYQDEPAYLLDGLRTTFGRYRGMLVNLNSLELGESVMRALNEKYPDTKHVDAVIMGVVVQAGLGQNPARIASTRAGVSLSTPALTLNSVCLASLEAACDATRRIRLREGDHYLVGGFDSMSKAAWVIPSEEITAETEPRSALFSDGLHCALTDLSMGLMSDGCNKELNVSREAQDDWAFLSHQRAAKAAPVRESDELISLQYEGKTLTSDEGIRAEPNREKMGALKPAFSPDGTITAANASQMSDGASAGLIVSGSYLNNKNTGQKPLAKIVDWAWVAGPDATLHLQPARAIRRLLEQQKMSAQDIDLYEINEAFAGVVLATMEDLELTPEKVNINGGAIAIGHPLGASGFRLLLTLALELKRSNKKYGIATLCGGGGQGLAVLIENAN